MMHATRTLEHGGVVQSQYFTGDAPEELMRHDGAASVEALTGYSCDFGRGKCSVTLRLQCDQNADAITRAFRVAFDAARTMALDGMQLIAQDAESFRQQGEH